jgi:hypothetical protein
MKTLFLSLLFIFTHTVQANVHGQAALYPEVASFDMFRNGQRVGDYRVTFKQNDGALTVEINMELNIKVLGLFNYSYSYLATELWKDDELYSLEVELNKNGDQQRRSWVSVKNHSPIVSDMKGVERIRADLLPTHHWYSKILSQKQVLNTIKAKTVAIDPQLEEQFVLNLAGQALLVNAYGLGGDLDNTQTWYDTDGVWRGMRFKAKDGSTVEVIWKGAQRMEVSS